MKNANRSILLITFIFSIYFPLFADNHVSRTGEELFMNFMDLRRKMALCETDAAALEEIKTFMQNDFEPIRNNLSEEEIMVMDNFYYTERYNYMKYDKDGGALVTENELLGQIDVNNQFYNEHKEEGFSPWWYVTSANVIGCYMSFHPVPVALKYGQKQKDYFKNAYEENPGFWYAASHWAQWLFFAPGIYGGGKKKAETVFLESLEIAQTDTEKYYSNIFLSQFYYTQGEKEKTAEYLDTADTYLPGGNYTAFIRKINSQGQSTFEYKEE